MRNRKVQRELRHEIGRAGGQEALEARNYFGNGDPTPQRVVRNIIQREKMTERLIRKGAIRCVEGTRS